MSWNKLEQPMTLFLHFKLIMPTLIKILKIIYINIL